MSNRYPGICYRCGRTVLPGEGVFEKVSKMSRKKWPELPRTLRWQTQHHDCAVRFRGTDTHYLYRPHQETDL